MAIDSKSLHSTLTKNPEVVRDKKYFHHMVNISHKNSGYSVAAAATAKTMRVCFNIIARPGGFFYEQLSPRNTPLEKKRKKDAERHEMLKKLNKSKW